MAEDTRRLAFKGTETPRSKSYKLTSEERKSRSAALAGEEPVVDTGVAILASVRKVAVRETKNSSLIAPEGHS